MVTSLSVSGRVLYGFSVIEALQPDIEEIL